MVAFALTVSTTAAASPEGVGLALDALNPPNEPTLRALDPTVPTDLHEIRRTVVTIGGGVQTFAARDDGECMDLCLTSGVDVYAVAPVVSRVSVVSRIWGRSLLDGTDSITYGMSTAGVRYNLARSVWVEAAAGMARATVDRDEDIDVTMGFVAPAASAGAGIDLTRVGSIELGIEARGGANLYSPGMQIYAGDLMVVARW